MATPEIRTLAQDGLRIELRGGTYDQPWTNFRNATLGDPISVTTVARFNNVGSAQIVLPAEWGRGPSTGQAPSKADSLRLPNAWMQISLRGRAIFNGPITKLTTTGPSEGTITVDCESHSKLIRGALIEPGETSSGTSVEPQIFRVTYATENRVESGQAAQVFNSYARNAIGPVWTAPPITPNWPDTTVDAKVRMKTLDTLIPLIDQFDIGVDVVVDVDAAPDVRRLTYYRGSLLDRTLTDRAGTVIDWEVTTTRPTRTGAIVGGQGEATDRVFIANHSYDLRPDAEQVRDDRAYTFVDARDATEDSVLVQRSKDSITEGAATTSLKATLAEGPGFRFIDDFWLGDRISFSLADDTVIMTERVNEVTVEWTRDQSLVVTPKVGDITASSDGKIVKAIAGIGRRTTHLETR